MVERQDTIVEQEVSSGQTDSDGSAKGDSQNAPKVELHKPGIASSGQPTSDKSTGTPQSGDTDTSQQGEIRSGRCPESAGLDDQHSPKLDCGTGSSQASTEARSPKPNVTSPTEPANKEQSTAQPIDSEPAGERKSKSLSQVDPADSRVSTSVKQQGDCQTKDPKPTSPAETNLSNNTGSSTGDGKTGDSFTNFESENGCRAAEKPTEKTPPPSSIPDVKEDSEQIGPKKSNKPQGSSERAALPSSIPVKSNRFVPGNWEVSSGQGNPSRIPKSVPPASSRKYEVPAEDESKTNIATEESKGNTAPAAHDNRPSSEKFAGDIKPNPTAPQSPDPSVKEEGSINEPPRPTRQADACRQRKPLTVQRMTILAQLYRAGIKVFPTIQAQLH